MEKLNDWEIYYRKGETRYIHYRIVYRNYNLNLCVKIKEKIKVWLQKLQKKKHYLNIVLPIIIIYFKKSFENSCRRIKKTLMIFQFRESITIDLFFTIKLT